MRSDTQHYKDAMMQWKERAETAEARCARMEEALKELLAANPVFRCSGIGAPGSETRQQQDAAIAAEDRARAALRESGTPAKLWRHIRRGSIYREIGRGFAQVTAHPIEEMTAVVIYEHDGKYWVRNAVEFDDGRFEPVMRESGTP